MGAANAEQVSLQSGGIIQSLGSLVMDLKDEKLFAWTEALGGSGNEKPL